MASTSGIVALKALLAKQGYSEKLSTLSDVKKFVEACYPSLEVEINDEEGASRWVIVCSTRYSRLQGSPVKPRVLFRSDGSYSLEILLNKVQGGLWTDSKPPHANIKSTLDTLLTHSGYVICPGIRSYDSEFEQTVRFKTKNLRVSTNPISRHDSTNCSIWHKPSNLRLSPSSPLFNLCLPCKTLHSDLTAIKNRTLGASPDHKEKWKNPSSTRPMKYLSPASQVERTAKGSQERRNLRKTILRYEHPLDVELNPTQDDELLQLVTAIDEKGQDQLDTVIAEANQFADGSGEELRKVWERDVTSRKEFYQDQLKNRMSARLIVA